MFRLFQKILITFLFLSISSFIWGVFADTTSSDQDITNSNYRIDLGNIDPLSASHSSATTTSGMGSLNYPLEQITNILLFLVPLIAGISLIIAGYYYILSSGDSEKASKAKTIIKWNLIAIIVAFLAYTIVNLVRYLLT